MKTAVLYQLKEPPSFGGVKKPMKKGGYRDSGADIAFTLYKSGYDIVIPSELPDEKSDLDWVFGDDEQGIEDALKRGADTLWLNTVLYNGHPIEAYIKKGIKIIGQRPCDVQKYDDKYYTNRLLANAGLSVAEQWIINKADDYIGKYPCVLKPVRGRGSQGVFVIFSKEELKLKVNNLILDGIYGNEFIIEPYLDGNEITISVFPGSDEPYCLPPVLRFNHINGIAPYNGNVEVTKNSRAVSDIENYADIIENCKNAYRILNLKAPIRIDCRQNSDGRYMMFDVNMKPNMTLGEREHRKNQDSLVMIAAKRNGWSRIDLLKAYIDTFWSV